MTIIDNGKPTTTIIDGKDRRDMSGQEQFFYDKTRAILFLVWWQYCAIIQKTIPYGNPIPPEVEEKARQTMDIDNATMLNIGSLCKRWGKEDEAIREEERQAEQEMKRKAEERRQEIFYLRSLNLGIMTDGQFEAWKKRLKELESGE